MTNSVGRLLTMPLFTLLFLLLLPACSRGEAPAVTDLSLELRLQPAAQELAGSADLRLAAGAAADLNLRLTPRAVIGGVTLGGAPLTHHFSAGRLSVPLPERKGEVTLRIEYAARFTDPVPQRIVSFEDPTFGVGATITPKGTFLGSGADWYPRPELLPGRITVKVTAPAGTEAITAGERTGHQVNSAETSSTWTVRRPTGTLTLSAGPYLVRERRLAGGTLLYTYFFQENDHLSAAYLDAAAAHLALFEGLFGPYPFEKFAVVENFLPTGRGFPSYTLLGSDVIRLPFILQTSLPHEIAHCWWGNGVLVDYAKGNWSEGLVTYLADHFLLERASPDEARDYRQRLLNDYAALVGPEDDFPLSAFSGRIDPPSRAIGYGKGAMLFHMVRTMIGDDAFYQGLRDIFREKLFQHASWDDFGQAFSRAAGRDLSGFIDPWLNRGGGPRLRLGRVAVAGSGAPWTVSGTVIQEPPLFQVPVTLELVTQEERIRQQLMTGKEKTPFAFGAGDPPREVRLDPEVDLFRIIPAGELPATVNRLKGAKKLTVVLAEGWRRDPALELLLESLGRKGAVVVAEKSLGGKAPEGELLFYGLPRTLSPFGDPPAGMELAADRFTVGGERFVQAGDALFLVLGQPRDPERVAALFLPLSAAAAAAAAPKVTHYGRFGVLVFRGGENRHKGVVTPRISQTVVDLSGGAALR